MIDFGQAMALMGSLKTAGEITQAMIGLRDATMIQTKVIELNGIIISAQSSALASNLSQMELLERVRTLEAELASMKEWDSSKDKYQLTKVALGAYAMMREPRADSAEPAHWLCVPCYEKRQKSVLQYQGRTSNNAESIWTCPACKNKIQTPWSATPDKVTAANKPAAAEIPGEECPRCHQKEFRMESSKPDRVFGDLGGMRDAMKCNACGHAEERFRK